MLVYFFRLVLRCFLLLALDLCTPLRLLHTHHHRGDDHAHAHDHVHVHALHDAHLHCVRDAHPRVLHALPILHRTHIHDHDGDDHVRDDRARDDHVHLRDHPHHHRENLLHWTRLVWLCR